MLDAFLSGLRPIAMVFRIRADAEDVMTRASATAGPFRDACLFFLYAAATPMPQCHARRA